MGRELYKSQELEHTLTGWSGRRAWLVGATNGYLASIDSDVAQPGDGYPNLPSVVCKRQRIRYRDIDYYVVTCEYNDEIDPTSSKDHSIGDVEENWTFETRSETAPIDRNGNPVGEDGEGVNVLVPHIQLVIDTWVRWNPNFQWIYNLIGMKSNAEFKGAAAGKWFCMGAVVDRVTRSMLHIQYILEYNASPSGWDYEWYETELREVQMPSGKKKKRRVPIGDSQFNVLYLQADFNTIYP